jgi:hypothetical protein
LDLPGQRFTSSATPSRRRRGAALCALLLGLAAGGTVAQEDPAAAVSTDAGADSSRRVDESEESYRARMELREQRFREQQRSNTTFTYSTSREGKLANLPPDSQEHIRAQLRDLVIESRLWKPGEDLSDYPYDPSPAAQRDRGLAGQEREAWVEQLQKYQERETAAGSAAGASDRETTAAARGADPNGRAAVAPPATGSGETVSDETAVAATGVTESALDFLQQQGLGPNELAPLADADGSGAAPDQQQPARMDGDQGSQADPAGQQAAEAPAGTLNIDELKQIEFAVATAGAADQPAAQAHETLTMRETAAPEPEAGTLRIEELRQLPLPPLRGEGEDRSEP